MRPLTTLTVSESRGLNVSYGGALTGANITLPLRNERTIRLCDAFMSWIQQPVGDLGVPRDQIDQIDQTETAWLRPQPAFW